MYEGSWSFFTKSRHLLNRGLLNRGLGVYTYFLKNILKTSFSEIRIGIKRSHSAPFKHTWCKKLISKKKKSCKISEMQSTYEVENYKR